MKIVLKAALSLLLIVCFSGTGHTEKVSSAMQRLGKEVATLSLGFGNYALGQSLTTEQKKFAQANSVKKSLKGTYKFLDGDVNVIAKNDDDMVIGIYKQFESASRDEVKTIVGKLMMRFDEPTTMAHDKLIYWAYNKNGRISQDTYDFAKQSGGSDIIATVKLQSSQSIFPDPDPQDKDKTQEKVDAQQEEADIYVMITSNPLSKIFLAQK